VVAPPVPLVEPPAAPAPLFPPAALSLADIPFELLEHPAIAKTTAVPTSHKRGVNMAEANLRSSMDSPPMLFGKKTTSRLEAMRVELRHVDPPTRCDFRPRSDEAHQSARRPPHVPALFAPRYFFHEIGAAVARVG
jgi:hypothetical protein